MTKLLISDLGKTVEGVFWKKKSGKGGKDLGRVG